MESFSRFLEDNEYLHAIKRQLPVTARTFLNLSITLYAGQKIGRHTLSQTMVAIVCDEDDSTVTLCPVNSKTIPYESGYDADGERDMTPGDPNHELKIRVPKNDLDALLRPPIQGN